MKKSFKDFDTQDETVPLTLLKELDLIYDSTCSTFSKFLGITIIVSEECLFEFRSSSIDWAFVTMTAKKFDRTGVQQFELHVKPWSPGLFKGVTATMDSLDEVHKRIIEWISLVEEIKSFTPGWKSDPFEQILYKSITDFDTTVGQQTLDSEGKLRVFEWAISFSEEIKVSDIPENIKPILLASADNVIRTIPSGTRRELAISVVNLIASVKKYTPDLMKWLGTKTAEKGIIDLIFYLGGKAIAAILN